MSRYKVELEVRTINQTGVDILIANTIIKIICDYYAIDQDILYNNKRLKYPASDARRYIIYFINKYTSTINKTDILSLSGMKKGSVGRFYSIIQEIDNEIIYKIETVAYSNLNKIIKHNVGEVQKEYYKFINT